MYFSGCSLYCLDTSQMFPSFIIHQRYVTRVFINSLPRTCFVRVVNVNCTYNYKRYEDTSASVYATASTITTRVYTWNVNFNKMIITNLCIIWYLLSINRFYCVTMIPYWIPESDSKSLWVLFLNRNFLPISFALSKNKHLY